MFYDEPDVTLARHPPRAEDYCSNAASNFTEDMASVGRSCKEPSRVDKQDQDKFREGVG